MRKIVKLFESGSVSISGMKGRGKDLLMSNVIARRRNLEYVSNINYGYKYIPFNKSDFDTNNNFSNFLNDNLNYYRFPFADKTDLLKGIYL